ncbi:sulfotransferase family protein [Sphingomonas lenta]|uniref:Sulfotransferase n=1 Tax=Sphingomonas lenta TaxID=1141887 RepID=A0A2A2SGZ9_9SPHN|nr:sulfotransferase [Sphingomonas lenta]PAX08537.1 sulfotransferase [Sphingomonas lenta]
MMLDVPAAHTLQMPARRRIAWANRALERSWAKGWSPVPDLSPDALVAEARKRVPGGELGDPGVWRVNLDVLCADLLSGEARLSALGKTMACGQLVAALRNRMLAHRLWAEHPEIADVPVARPVLVLGQMRSGTTRMQRLLACDPRLSWTRHYESWCPVGRARRLRAAATLGVMRALNPEFSVIHPTSAGAPDEEIGLFSLATYGATFEAQWRVPGFARWCEGRDTRPVYAEFKRLLQTIAWLRGGREHRPWVVKVPQLTQDLASVLETFPDARLVRVERDPVATVASAASLVRNQMRVQSDAVDDAWIGREWLGKVRLRRERVEAALAARPEVPVVEVAFDNMNRDWSGEMRRVYAVIGLELTPKVERRMRRYLARAAREGRGGHRYAIEEFGLSEGEVRAALA